MLFGGSSFFCLVLIMLLLPLGESALAIVLKKITEGLQGVEEQEATTEK